VRATLDLSECEIDLPFLFCCCCMTIGRVIVTSSPLYQPMDGIEQLGYELRVYVRVPDLGMYLDLLDFTFQGTLESL